MRLKEVFERRTYYMKTKISELSSVFSKAIIQPVMFLSVTGLLLTIGVILKMDVMPAFIANIGN